MNTKQSPFDSVDDPNRFITVYQKLTHWERVEVNVKMFIHLAANCVKGIRTRSLKESGAALACAAEFFTGAVWPMIWQPLLLFTLAAITGLLAGFTMWRLTQ